MYNARIDSARILDERSSYKFFGDYEPLEFDAKNVTNLAVIACGYNVNQNWDDTLIQSVTLTYCDNDTEKKLVTKEEQVPYQVEKQRTVMKTIKVPFWEAIFH
jgi:hypothetical protein